MRPSLSKSLGVDIAPLGLAPAGDFKMPDDLARAVILLNETAALVTKAAAGYLTERAVRRTHLHALGGSLQSIAQATALIFESVEHQEIVDKRPSIRCFPARSGR